MYFKTGSTYKQKTEILLKHVDSLNEEIFKLKSMLAEKEINPLDYQRLGETCMKYYQALMTIKLTHNAATQAYELSDSALRDE